jgi:hypothetical protein
VLEIHQDQLLVLLLVVETEIDQLLDLRIGAARAQQPIDLRIHVLAIGEHFFDRRAREHAALGPPVPGTDRLIIRVEEKAELLVEHAVTRLMRHEHELLEEPGRVSEVPLCRARVRHALHDVVFGRERRAQRDRHRAHIGEALGQRDNTPAGQRGCGP